MKAHRAKSHQLSTGSDTKSAPDICFCLFLCMFPFNLLKPPLQSSCCCDPDHVNRQPPGTCRHSAMTQDQSKTPDANTLWCHVRGCRPHSGPKSQLDHLGVANRGSSSEYGIKTNKQKFKVRQNCVSAGLSLACSSRMLRSLNCKGIQCKHQISTPPH